MIETLNRLRQSAVFWGALGVFAMIFIGLTAASLRGTFLEDYAVQFRLVGVVGMFACFIIGLLVVAVEPLTRFSRYLGRGIRALARFARENLLVVVPLIASIFLLWRLFDLAHNPAVFSMVSLLVVACIAMTVGLIRLVAIAQPSFLGLPVRAARRELELTYQGKAGDEVGPGPGRLGSDGHEDATFLLEVLWRQRRQIAQIELFRIDSEGNRLGERWTSSRHPGIWQLGVVGRTQEGTVAVSRGPWIVPANETSRFLLYASDWVPPQAWFTEGQWYEVLVQHDGGSSRARTRLRSS